MPTAHTSVGPNTCRPVSLGRPKLSRTNTQKSPTGERQCPKFQVFHEVRQTTQAGANLSHTRRTGPFKTILRKRAPCGALAPRGETGVQGAQAPRFRKNAGASGAECVSLTVGLYTQRKGACSSVTCKRDCVRHTPRSPTPRAFGDELATSRTRSRQAPRRPSARRGRTSDEPTAGKDEVASGDEVNVHKTCWMQAPRPVRTPQKRWLRVVWSIASLGCPKVRFCLHETLENELTHPNERARVVTRTGRHDACLHFPTSDFLGRFSFWPAFCMLAARSSARRQRGRARRRASDALLFDF